MLNNGTGYFKLKRLADFKEPLKAFLEALLNLTLYFLLILECKSLRKLGGFN
jgi:hypothetical protein